MSANLNLFICRRVIPKELINGEYVPKHNWTPTEKDRVTYRAVVLNGNPTFRRVIEAEMFSLDGDKSGIKYLFDALYRKSAEWNHSGNLVFLVQDSDEDFLSKFPVKIVPGAIGRIEPLNPDEIKYSNELLDQFNSGTYKPSPRYS